MSVVDSLLLAGGVAGLCVGLVWLIVHDRRLGWRDWLVGWVLSSVAVNILLWRLDDWTPRGGLGLSLILALTVAVMIWRWNSPYDIGELDAKRRREHYRNYPFNQWKPKDVDELPT